MKRREFITLRGGVAARGACAAVGDAGDRVSQPYIPCDAFGGTFIKISSGLEGERLYRE
jgi:hypothetical protein